MSYVIGRRWVDVMNRARVAQHPVETIRYPALFRQTSPNEAAPPGAPRAGVQ